MGPGSTQNLMLPSTCASHAVDTQNEAAQRGLLGCPVECSSVSHDNIIIGIS